MYPTLLQVAHDIIIIGGALMIVIGVILLFVMLIVTLRINRVISKTVHLVTMISQYVILPFSYLAGMFSKSGEEKEAAPKSKKAGSGKK